MTNQQTNDSLARSIESLGAVEVAPGRYAVPMGGLDKPTSWALATAEQLAAREPMTSMKPQDYPRLPSWWSPERRFAITTGTLETFPDLEMAEAFRDLNYTSLDHIVTASLQTGEEIPA